MKRTTVDIIQVFRSPLAPSRGTVVMGNLRFPCALGRGGVTHRKREGDGCTLAGTFGLIRAHYRRDKHPRPRTPLALKAIRPNDGWCDAPEDPRYNQPVTLPHRASCERMWRDDDVYDVVIDLAINRRPVIRGRGSALFLHIARPGYTPTQGCIAIAAKHMARLLARTGPRTKIEIMG